jgi:hypothetical protein
VLSEEDANIPQSVRAGGSWWLVDRWMAPEFIAAAKNSPSTSP